MTKIWIILANSCGELDRQSVDMEWPIKAADEICALIRTWTLQPGDTIRVEEFSDDDLTPGTFSDLSQRAREKIADHVDGYDRDDLGESPDY